MIHREILLTLMLLLVLHVLITSALPTATGEREAPTTPVICSEHAGCMRGIYMPGYQTERFEAYLGIPYALPPVGELRFSSPKMYPKWQGVYNATAAKADCIQKNYLLPNPIVYGEEDCLYLNVYRPIQQTDKLLPVMVYIHGGGFFSGSAGPQLTGPEYIMDAAEVLLVTMAYRLGALGFLSTDDSNMPGNFGLKDQNLALRWVQHNIAAFNGDPSKVSLFGQSAGAVLSHLHVLSPQSVGLFRNMIALSGTANVPFAINEAPLAQARQTAALCNITDAHTLSTVKLSRALRNVDVVTLLNAGDGLKFWNVDHLTNYRPTVERSSLGAEAFLTEHPRHLLASGKYNPVPWLAGSVIEEGAVRVVAILENDTLRQDFNENFDKLLKTMLEFPNHLDAKKLAAKMPQIIEAYFQGEHELNNKTAKGFLDTITDRGFIHPLYNAIYDYVHSVNTDKYPLYLYRFNYSGPYTYASVYTNVKRKQNYGVVHCDDLLYLFRSPLLFPDFERNSTHARMIETFVNYFVHFAKFSKPVAEPAQRPCNAAGLQNAGVDSICDYHEFVNVLSDSFAIKTDNKLNVRRMKLWRNILEDEDLHA